MCINRTMDNFQGRTKLYNKYGRFRLDTKTLLPGGHPNKGYQKTDCCVLDGFYDSLSNSVYILDLLAWNNQAMTDGEVSLCCKLVMFFNIFKHVKLSIKLLISN